MNKTLINVARSLLLAFAVTNIAMAVPINGTITFTGGAKLDSTSAGTATSVTEWTKAKVESSSGDFSTYVTDLDAVALNAPWSFNSAAIENFWSVDGFVFDLISSKIAFQGFGAVIVTGEGTVSGHGFDPFVGSWSFTTQDRSAGGVFSFSGSTSVPDSGTTAMLLGTALVGLSLMARRRKIS